MTVPPTGIYFQPDGACNAVKSLNGGAGAGAGGPTGNQTTHCPPPFITDPMEGPNGGPTNPQYCFGGCCIPCPAQYSLYREGALETGFKITNTMRAVSMVFSFILMVSYIFLPDKRSHPSALILFFAICVFLFSVVVIFPLVDTRAMQCVGPVNPSTQHNNLKCAIQGTVSENLRLKAVETHESSKPSERLLYLLSLLQQVASLFSPQLEPAPGAQL